MPPPIDLFSKRLLIVSGKGGVGKTVISSALGLIASSMGKNVLLVSMDDQGRRAQLFGNSDGVSDRVTPLRENVSAINLNPTTIVADYFQRQLRIRRLVKHIVGSKLFQSWFRVSPAIKEMICLGKVLDLTEESSWWRRKSTWDLVVFDAPATGHGLGLLRLPEQAGKLLMGVMRKNALAVEALLKNQVTTGLVLVSIPEEMPVSETVHFYEAARALDMPLSCVVLNSVFPPRFGEDGAEQVESAFTSPAVQAAVKTLLGNGVDPAAALPAFQKAARYSRSQRELTERYAKELRDRVKLSRIDVPHVFTESFGFAELEQIAASLDEALQAGGAA